MSIDSFIIASAFGEFCIFWVLHVIFFRRIKPEFVIRWLVFLYLLTGFAGGVSSIWTFKQTINPAVYQNSEQTFLALTFIFIIFSLLVGVYIIGVFGVIESSIRIKLLSLISSAKTKGLTEIDMYKKYNKESIIDKRLLRLRSSGELMLRKGKYYIGRRWSLLSCMTRVSEFIAWIYTKRS